MRARKESTQASVAAVAVVRRGGWPTEGRGSRASGGRYESFLDARSLVLSDLGQRQTAHGRAPEERAERRVRCRRAIL